MQADIAVTTSSGEYETATATETEIDQEQQQQAQQQQRMQQLQQQREEQQRQQEQQLKRQQREEQKRAMSQQQLQQQQAARQAAEKKQQQVRQQFLQQAPRQTADTPEVSLNSALASLPATLGGVAEAAWAAAVDPTPPEEQQLYASPPLLPTKDYGMLMGGQYPFQYDPVYGLPIVRDVAKYGEVLRDIRQVG